MPFYERNLSIHGVCYAHRPSNQCPGTQRIPHNQKVLSKGHEKVKQLRDTMGLKLYLLVIWLGSCTSGSRPHYPAASAASHLPAAPWSSRPHPGSETWRSHAPYSVWWSGWCPPQRCWLSFPISGYQPKVLQVELKEKRCKIRSPIKWEPNFKHQQITIQRSICFF